MPQTFTTDELQALVVYPFKDPDWKNKFLVGTLVGLAGFIIPIIPFVAIYGYAAQVKRRLIHEGGEPFLPEWDDWGQFLKQDLRRSPD